MGLWREMIDGMKGHVCQAENEEADDVIYTIAMLEFENFDEIYIVTVDHDMLQCLVSENITLLRPVPQKTEELWTLKRVRTELGVEPNALPAKWAREGEASDNLPPASSEEEFEKLLGLITLRQLVPEAVHLPITTEIDIQGLRELYERFEFKSLLKKLN
jgi:hypothetical protein